MAQPDLDPEQYPPIDPREPIPDDPGELLPDAPGELPEAPSSRCPTTATRAAYANPRNRPRSSAHSQWMACVEASPGVEPEVDTRFAGGPLRRERHEAQFRTCPRLESNQRPPGSEPGALIR
jgi:hypothetical protein